MNDDNDYHAVIVSGDQKSAVATTAAMVSTTITATASFTLPNAIVVDPSERVSIFKVVSVYSHWDNN